MRYFLLTLILLFIFSGCNTESKNHAQDKNTLQATQAEKEALLAELKAKDKALQKAREEAKAAKEKLLAEEKARKEAFITKQKEKKEALKQNEKLSKVGITVQNNTIIIDTNKTKNFFESVGKNLGEKLKKMTQDLEKGMLNDKNAGVDIDEKHINIDLNKTKDFLEAWGKKMQGFVKEFDDMAKEMDIETERLEKSPVKRMNTENEKL